MRFDSQVSLLLMLVAPTLAVADPPYERRLPPETLVAILTDDAANFVRLWGQTQYPALANDPLMAPFIADVDAQLRQGPILTGALGLTWEDVKSVVSGPAAAAVVQTQTHKTGLLALIDTKGRGTQRTFLMARVIRSVIGHKGRLEMETIDGASVTVLVIPVQDGTRTVRVFILVKDGVLILADDRSAFQGILKRWNGTVDCLADRKDFQIFRNRAQFSGKPAHLTAFVDAAGSTAFYSQPGGDKAPPGLIKILNDEGLAQIKAIGAAARVGDGPFDMMLRLAIYAPPPYEKVMKLFRLRNSARLEPEPFVPAWATHCVTVSLNMPDVLGAFSGVFDHLTGKSGDLDAVVDALRDDPEGPQADVRRDLIDNLTGRLYVVGAGPLPGRDQAGRSLFAFRARDEKRLSACVGRLLANDDTVQNVTIGGLSCWRITPNRKRTGNESELPPAVIAIAKGFLLIANDDDLMASILTARTGGPLTGDSGYRRVDAELKALHEGDASARLFERPQEGLRGVYELARLGRLRRSPNFSAQAVRALLERAQLTGEKLPEFDKINHYLQPIGGIDVARDDGSDIVLFSLKRPTAAKPVDKK